MADNRSDEQLFEELYRATYLEIVAYCRRRITPDAVDDVVAATYLVAWRKLDDVLDADSSLAWLYGAAYKTIGNHIRSRRRLIALRDRTRRQAAPRAISTELSFEISDELRLTLTCLESLSPEDQEIIRLAAFEGLSHEEIAQALGGTAASARSRLHRARKRLRVTFDIESGESR